MTRVAANFVEWDGAMVLFFLQHQLKMGLILLLAPQISTIPAEEHFTDGRIPAIAGDPDFAVIIHLAQMFSEKIKVFSFAFAVGVLVNSIFAITQLFAGFAS